MTQPSQQVIEILARPEPHFPEGRHWPRGGWRGWVLWLVGVGISVVALIAVCATEMVVAVSLSGSVISAASDRNGGIEVVLFADHHTRGAVKVGQRVRLRVDERAGWGIVMAVEDMPQDGDGSYAKVAVDFDEPSTWRKAVPGHRCDGRVLVGTVTTIRGLWRLVTNQQPHANRGENSQLSQRIP